MSGRPGIGQKRFSRDRFQVLPDNTTKMNNPRDATIDIPLTTVHSHRSTGARKADTVASPSAYVPHSDMMSPQSEPNEKYGLFHSEGGRRKINTDLARQAESPEDGTLTRMGKFYDKILHFSVITRYFLYVLPLALLIAIPIIVGATAAPDARIGGVKIVWFFTWIEVVWLSLWVSKSIAHYIPFVFQFLCGIVSSGTRKYALILKALEIPLSLVGWSVTSLATFIPLMTQNPDQRARNDTATKGWQNTMKNILFAAFVSTVLLAAEKVLVQLISISYHRKQFDLKIKDSKRNIYLLGQLYEASRALFPEYCKEFAEEDYVISDSIGGKAIKVHKRTGSASPMRLIQNVGRVGGRVGDKITAAFGNVAQEITGKQVFNPTSAHSIVINALEKPKSAEALARRIWTSFVLHGRDALYLDDIVDVLGAGREAEAEECFESLDRDGNGDVSLEESILTVAEYGRVRSSIANSMRDVAQAIHVLDNLLCTIVSILVILVFVAFLNSGFGTTLAAGATAMLSLSFVFATTAQEVLGSCIFLFVKHPYDVGDRVDINDKPLIVERISLLFTMFRSVTDQKTVQVPNIVLNTNWIDNISRSKAMREQVNLTADFGTTFGDIQLLKQEMQTFVQDKENNRDFQPEVDIEVLGVGDMNKLELRIEIRHKSNWSNETIRAARRSKFMCALVLAIRKVPIYGPGGGDAGLGSSSNPSYSVAVSHEQAQAGKSEHDESKEKIRMVPTDDMDIVLAELNGKSTATNFNNGQSAEGLQYRGQGSTQTSAMAAAATVPNETAFAGILTSRPPAMDKARMDESDVLCPQDMQNIKAMHGDSADLGREPSTGRRTSAITSAGLVSPNTPVIEEPPSTQHQHQHQHQQPVADYHEYMSPYITTGSSTGRESPYQSNNPYAPSLPQLPAGYAPGTSPVSSPPPGPSSQSPPSHRPAPGNSFQQQQQQQHPR
ncbi:hypothetical protein AJ80_00835 [Polytolypa hystricis UAMH7299]|uniref:EF-hand domain-containing protein n=1 Tax=Polytolypa hystricis (strain UAMH7299) TaxID=1447883 RepID=A0A2B7Z3G5_POLH7|nr:hypothetical protein AJ80_00835 [Polytolypa hystricis UAMH7299]